MSAKIASRQLSFISPRYLEVRDNSAPAVINAGGAQRAMADADPLAFGSTADVLDNSMTADTNANGAVAGAQFVGTSADPVYTVPTSVPVATPTASVAIVKSATQPNTTVSASPTTAGSLKTFSVADGQVIGPSGTPFIAKGINLYDSQMSTVITSSAGGPLTTLFPGINMVRLACENYESVSSLSAFIAQMTELHIVVEIEDHTAPSGSDNVLTSSVLATELAWYSSLAAAFATNPYVWFGTMNEPNDTSNEAAVTSQQVDIYNAIRGAGDANPVLMEQIGGYTSTLGRGLTAASYSAMTNIIWDTHYYGWVANYSTSAATISSDLAAQIANAQSIKSADGTVPVIIGEYGISTTGSGAADPNGTQVVTSVDSSGYGSLAWAWSAGTDALVSGKGNTLSAFGTQVARYIASSTSSPTPTPVASPNDTVVMTGMNSAIVDAGGNRWTITGTGQIAVNGTTDLTTAGVEELAYVNGKIWQENADNLWWGKTTPSASWSPNGGIGTSPLPEPSITIPLNHSSATVGASQISAVATAGNHMVFVSGSDDTIRLIGGSNTITDTGDSNTYVIPAAGKGSNTFTSDVLNTNDILDLRFALSATNWNGSYSTLSRYLSVANVAGNSVLSMASTSRQSAVAVATIDGAGSVSLATLLTHAIT